MSPSNSEKMAHVAMKAWLEKYYHSSNYQRVKFFMQYTRSKLFPGKTLQPIGCNWLVHLIALKALTEMYHQKCV